jgi:hypothetical protein
MSKTPVELCVTVTAPPSRLNELVRLGLAPPTTVPPAIATL